MYARKQKAHDNGNSISRRLCRAMLSESSSFMATYCCDLIFCVSLALIGGRADERTTAPSPGVLGVGSSAARAGEVKLAEVAIVVEVDAIAPLVVGANAGSPAREAGCGKTPKGVDATPVRDKPTSQPNKVGDWPDGCLFAGRFR